MGVWKQNKGYRNGVKLYATEIEVISLINTGLIGGATKIKNTSWWIKWKKYESFSFIISIINTIFFHRKSGDSSGSRQIRNTPDWSDNAVSGDHLWVPTSVSGDCCYVGDSDCTVSSLNHALCCKTYSLRFANSLKT